MENYYVDNPSSYWNAFRLWSYNVRNEQISLTAYKKTQPRLGFLLSVTVAALANQSNVLLLAYSYQATF